MKKWIGLIVVLISLAGYYIDFDLGITSAAVVNSYISDSGSLEVYMCPGECEERLVGFLDSATTSIDCALFDVGLESVQEALLRSDIPVRVVTDNDYIHKFDHPFVRADKSGLMHNKFCIVDGKMVSTGSMNPTSNGANKNNNNLLLISSSAIATNYQDEFDEMWNGTFKKGNLVRNPSVNLDGVKIETYFCPEDRCADRIKEELKKATSSIKFMTFSFTHEGIANILMMKHVDGLDVEGVMEARQVSKYSQMMRLNTSGIDVVKDGNKNNMHHKVFIIDNEIVITGSFNPTNNGDKGNDENILIISDRDIASLYLEEYEKVRAQTE